MSTNNMHILDHEMVESNMEKPPTPDGNHPPNLSQINPGHGGSGDGNSDIGAGGDASTNSNDTDEMIGYANGYESDSDTDDNASLYNDHPVSGDEGAEDHLVEVGDLGFVRMRTIQETLEKHGRHICACRCRCGCHYRLTTGRAFGSFDSLADSGTLSPLGSMIVEVGSAGMSMNSSTVSLGPRSLSVGSLFNHTGGAFDDGPALDSVAEYPSDLFDE